MLFFSFLNFHVSNLEWIGDHSLLLKEVLENTVIPVAIETNDCWLASIAFWLLNKQKEAVRSIVVPLSQFSEKHIDTSETDSAATVQNPNSFILYNHLKASLQQIGRAHV